MDYNRVKAFCLKYLVWFLVPILILYGLDFLKLMLSLLEIIVITVVLFQNTFLIIGAALGILSLDPSRDYDFLFRMRGNKFVPMFSWGFSLSKWLLKDAKKDPEKETKSKVEFI